MKRISEARKGGRRINVGAPGALRGQSIDLGNIDAKPVSSGLPGDAGVMDHKRLYKLFESGLKVIHRQGKGNDLESFIESGLNSLNRLKSAARILSSNPRQWRGGSINRDRYVQDAGESKQEVLKLYESAQSILSRLISQSVGRAYLKASDADKKAIATIRSFDDIPDNFETITRDEAELISEIFFKGSERASKDEAIQKVSQIVNSFIKLDEEVMADEDTVHNILTRLQTFSKNAKLNKDQFGGAKRAPIAEPTAGYGNVDLAIKRRITAAFGRGDLDEVKAQLSAQGRDDLVGAVGSKSEGQILKAYVTGKPIQEGFVSMYDFIVEDLLVKYSL